VGIFSRGGKAKDAAASVTEPADLEAEDGADETGDAVDAVDTVAFERTNGPFDRSEMTALEDYIDLGLILVNGVEGMQLRLELDPEQTHVMAATAVLGESTLQLQAFAAPRSGGLWAEIRDEIAASVVSRGGTAEVHDGPFGQELRTRVPQADAVGRTVFAPARFLGVDGPRWFLRGVLGGRAAVEEQAAAPMLDFFGRTVVVRDGEPMPPRELLALTLPKDAAGPDPADAESGGSEPGQSDRSGELNPFERGPEITEVR